MNVTLRVAAVAIVLGLLPACSRQMTVRIGVAAPMSGPLAEQGKDIAHGAQIAVDELNAQNFRIDGRRAHFELVVEDDKASAAEGQAAAKRLIGKEVAAVYGHLNSGVSIAAAPLYSAAGIPQMSASTNPQYTRMGLKTAFRIGADDVEQGGVLARLISDRLMAKKIYMLDDHTTFGVGLADEVGRVLQSKNGGMQRESIDPKGTDYAALAQKIMAAGPDVVFFGGDAAAGLPLLKALRKDGSAVQFVSGDAMCDPSILKDAGGLSDKNYYCTVPGVPPSWLSGGMSFVQAFNARFGSPGANAPMAYDSIHVLAQAMQRAGSIEPGRYVAELSNGSFDGKIQGAVEFDGKGDIKDGTVVLYKSIDGKLTEQRTIR